jgi:hypothetical protein
MTNHESTIEYFGQIIATCPDESAANALAAAYADAKDGKVTVHTPTADVWHYPARRDGSHRIEIR